MDDPEAVPAPRGKTRTLGRLGPLAVVAAAVGVACVVATPDGTTEKPPGGAEMDPAKIDSFVKRFRRGQQLFGSGKDAEAEAIFRQLLAEQPDAAAVHHALAYVEWYRGHVPEAIEGFQKAAQLAPEDGAIRRDLGLRLFEAGRPADALPHIEAARRLLDADVETICTYGRVLVAVRRPAEAERAFREALALEPGSVDARSLLAQMIGPTRPTDALALLEGVPPNWPDVVEARAMALERLGRWDEAALSHVRLSELAQKGDPGIPLLRDATEGLIRCGDAARAVVIATKWIAADRRGDHPSQRASVGLAVAKAGAGDAAGALAAMDATPVAEDAPAVLRTQLALIRVHLLVESGQAAAARELLAKVAECELPFEKLLARRVLGKAPAAELESAAAKEPSRANDVPWAAWLAARLAGEAPDAPAVATLRKQGIELSLPPGEHPGMLLRGAR